MTRAVVVNVLASILIALFYAGIVALSGGPGWACVSVALLTYAIYIGRRRQ